MTAPTMRMLYAYSELKQNTPFHKFHSKIFQPIFDTREMDDQVLTSAEVFISVFAKRVSWVNMMIAHPPKESEQEYAKLMYIEMIKSIVSGIVFGDTERSIATQLGPKQKELHAFDVDTRKLGKDWTYLGDTMTGFARLDNVRDLLLDVLKNNIKGGYIGEKKKLFTYHLIFVYPVICLLVAQNCGCGPYGRITLQKLGCGAAVQV